MPRLVNAGADLAPVVGAVVDDLGEAERDRRVEVPAAVLFDCPPRRRPLASKPSTRPDVAFALRSSSRVTAVSSSSIALVVRKKVRYQPSVLTR